MEVAINDYPERWPGVDFEAFQMGLDSARQLGTSGFAAPLRVRVSGTLRTQKRRSEKRIEAARAAS